MVDQGHRRAGTGALGPRAVIAALAALLLLLVPSTATAQELVRPPSLDTPPKFHRLTGTEVMAIADRVAKIRDEREKYPGSTREVFTKGPARWQVSYFSKGRK